MTHTAVKDDRYTALAAEEEAILKVLAPNNHHAALGDQIVQWSQVIDKAFLNRIEKYLENAAELHVVPTAVLERLEATWDFTLMRGRAEMRTFTELMLLAPEDIRNSHIGYLTAQITQLKRAGQTQRM